jgi:hypothetical protein
MTYHYLVVRLYNNSAISYKMAGLLLMMQNS